VLHLKLCSKNFKSGRARLENPSRLLKQINSLFHWDHVGVKLDDDDDDIHKAGNIPAYLF